MTKEKEIHKPLDPWEGLIELIQAYGDACRADETKGGGDPADFDVIEKECELATLKVNSYIEKMKRQLT